MKNQTHQLGWSVDNDNKAKKSIYIAEENSIDLAGETYQFHILTDSNFESEIKKLETKTGLDLKFLNTHHEYNGESSSTNAHNSTTVILLHEKELKLNDNNLKTNDKLAFDDLGIGYISSGREVKTLILKIDGLSLSKNNKNSHNFNASVDAHQFLPEKAQKTVEKLSAEFSLKKDDSNSSKTKQYKCSIYSSGKFDDSLGQILDVDSDDFPKSLSTFLIKQIGCLNNGQPKFVFSLENDISKYPNTTLKAFEEWNKIRNKHNNIKKIIDEFVSALELAVVIRNKAIVTKISEHLVILKNQLGFSLTEDSINLIANKVHKLISSINSEDIVFSDGKCSIGFKLDGENLVYLNIGENEVKYSEEEVFLKLNKITNNYFSIRNENGKYIEFNCRSSYLNVTKSDFVKATMKWKTIILNDQLTLSNRLGTKLENTGKDDKGTLFLPQMTRDSSGMEMAVKPVGSKEHINSFIERIKNEIPNENAQSLDFDFLKKNDSNSDDTDDIDAVFYQDIPVQYYLDFVFPNLYNNKCENMILYVGTSGAGKSTLINDALGRTFVFEKYSCEGIKEYSDEEIMDERLVLEDCNKEHAAMGISTSDSLTLFPQLYEEHADTAGLLDTRGPLCEDMNMFNLKLILNQSASLKCIVVVVNYADLNAARSHNFVLILKALQMLNPYESLKLSKLRSNIKFVINDKEKSGKFTINDIKIKILNLVKSFKSELVSLEKDQNKFQEEIKSLKKQKEDCKKDVEENLRNQYETKSKLNFLEIMLEEIKLNNICLWSNPAKEELFKNELKPKLDNLKSFESKSLNTKIDDGLFLKRMQKYVHSNYLENLNRLLISRDDLKNKIERKKLVLEGNVEKLKAFDLKTLYDKKNELENVKSNFEQETSGPIQLAGSKHHKLPWLLESSANFFRRDIRPQSGLQPFSYKFFTRCEVNDKTPFGKRNSAVKKSFQEQWDESSRKIAYTGAYECNFRYWGLPAGLEVGKVYYLQYNKDDQTLATYNKCINDLEEIEKKINEVNRNKIIVECNQEVIHEQIKNYEDDLLIINKTIENKMTSYYGFYKQIKPFVDYVEERGINLYGTALKTYLSVFEKLYPDLKAANIANNAITQPGDVGCSSWMHN